MDQSLISIQESIQDDYLSISLIPPFSVQSRTNSNICCVVDVSGSMGDLATITSSTDSCENYKLSVMDIVKHAIKMIINTLTSHDFLSVVTFSNQQSVLFDLLPMNDSNKSFAIEKIEGLTPNGGTQLWKGLQNGLDILQKNNNLNTNQSIFLLTDGQPTDLNIEINLISYKKNHPNFNCTLNTFGFSSQSNSSLLNTLSQHYNGMFSFIPDASIIATTFANTLANTLTVFTSHALLHITTLKKTKLIVPECLNILWNEYKKGSQEILIDVGVINTQQTRDFIFKIENISDDDNKQSFANAKLIYSENHYSKEQVKYNPKPRVIEKTLISREQRNKILNHIYRYKMIDAITDSIQKYTKDCDIQSQIKENLFQLIEEMEKILSDNDRHFDGIYKDLVSTVSEAFKNEYQFNNWGQHYLLSLKRSHLIQQCNTYKDPGVQHYGQSLFQQLRAVADEIFCKMPPPKPYSNSQQYNNQSSIQYTDAYNMNDYHNYSSGGCIHGDSLVFLPNRQTKRVSEIKKGDIVRCKSFKSDCSAEVVCVVISKCQESTKFISLGDNLWITYKHPIRTEGIWKYPKSVGEISKKKSEQMYQFVLKEKHTINIGGYEVICLGHEFDEPIAKHEYLGTKKVIKDLEGMNGWEDGIVRISQIKREMINKKLNKQIL